MLALAEVNREVRCIVLTGSGAGFCAGGDVKGMAASGDGTVGAQTIDEAIARQRVNQRATAGKLFSMPKPTIAAVNGAAVAGGAGLVSVCDLAVADPGAKFGYPEVKRGLFAAAGGLIRAVAAGT